MLLIQGTCYFKRKAAKLTSGYKMVVSGYDWEYERRLPKGDTSERRKNRNETSEGRIF